MFSTSINSKLRNSICVEHFENIITTVKKNIVSDRLRDAVNMIEADYANAWNLKSSKEFKEITAPFINW